GSQFTLDLRVNTGDNNINAAQNYLTFTHTVLQNVLVGSPGCGTITSTLTADTTILDAVLQNEVCNGPGQCHFRTLIVDPGSIAFASGALSHAPPNGDFRVAQEAFCAIATGDALLHWQFSPPDPITRDTNVVDQNGNPVSNRTF